MPHLDHHWRPSLHDALHHRRDAGFRGNLTETHAAFVQRLQTLRPYSSFRSSEGLTLGLRAVQAGD